MRMPPDMIDNQYQAVAQFIVPKSYLERKIKMFLLVKDETKATAHAMPDEIAGFTDILSDALMQILFSTHHERQIFPIQYDPKSTALGAMQNTQTNFEISCHPL